MPKPLPEPLKLKSQAVKAAHADLAERAPGFTKKPAQDQIRLAQRHALRLFGKGQGQTRGH